MSGVNTAGRPVEKHIVAPTEVESQNLTFLQSMAYAERHVAKMLNMQNSAMTNIGVYKGLIVEPDGGLGIRIVKDASGDLGGAVVKCGDVQVQVFQQHDYHVMVPTGRKITVALQANWEEGVITKQVSAISTIEPAEIVIIQDGVVGNNQIILAEIDLTGGETTISQSMIDITNRPVGGIDLVGHRNEPNPHPDLKNRDSVNRIDHPSDNLMLGEVNLFTKPMIYNLLPEDNGKRVAVMVSSTAGADKDNPVKLLPPGGESIFLNGKEYLDIFIIDPMFKTELVRDGDRWYATS